MSGGDTNVEPLRREAKRLGEHLRAYFGREELAALPAAKRIPIAQEGLKATARLMIIEEWLARIGRGGRRLRNGPPFDPKAVVAFPDEARDLVEASVDLYGRAYRVDQGEEIPQPMENPVRGLLRRLERSI